MGKRVANLALSLNRMSNDSLLRLKPNVLAEAWRLAPEFVQIMIREEINRRG